LGPKKARFGQHLPGFTINSTGKLPGQRRKTREADLSTQQTGAQAPSRFPCPSRHSRRPQGPRRSPRPRPQASERLSRTPFWDFIMDRLRQRADFLAVANGARVNSPAFVLQSLDRKSLDRQNPGRDDSGPIRIGFTVTKKNGNAPQRNRIRRRLRELVKRVDPVSMQPHHDYVLVGRRDALSRDFATMLDDLRRAFTKPSRQAHKGRGPKPGSSPVLSRPDPSRPDSGPAAAAGRKPD